MPQKKRTTRGAEVKAKVAIAALTGKPTRQLVNRFGVHPTQRHLEEAFTSGRAHSIKSVND